VSNKKLERAEAAVPWTLNPFTARLFMTNFKHLMSPWKRRRKHKWPKEWQEKLSELLESATQRLKLNLVFIVAEESDPYSELLFLFSFAGVSAGFFVGLALKIFQVDLGIDQYVFPLLGFTGFGLFHTRKSQWLQKSFKNLAAKRVQQRARDYFYDYYSTPHSPLILIHLSESERRMEILRSPDLNEQLSPVKIDEIKKIFYRKYKSHQPMTTIQEIIDQLVHTLAPLRQEIETKSGKDTSPRPEPMFVVASDLELRFVPVLKGNTDIN
jgi:hypothetical protein